jgi:hypothetical protein
MFRVIGVAAMAALLSACAASSAMTGEYTKGSGKTLAMGKQVWSGFESYASKVSVANPGGFAVAIRNGEAIAYAYSYCPEGHCIGESSTVWAMDHCRQYGVGDCVLFASSSEILVNYRVENQ